jgi:hypothetical protein
MRKFRQGLVVPLVVAAIAWGWADHAESATYARIEVAFDLPDLKGNPFDYTENDVRVAFAGPGGGQVTVPAFFDGGATWRARHTPEAAGRFLVKAVTVNGKAVEPPKLAPRELNVTGPPVAGFVRIDGRDPTRFAFDNGEGYYPLGHNAAWGNVAAILEKMGAGGENWSRVWMCHWGGTNLDWVTNRPLAPGELSLDVARRWDAIVAAAEKGGIRFQMVLQHHGQYSTRTNPNWNENPWNRSRGGWLASPEEFFTDPRALALTKAKYRYIVARWAASPAILAWEIFNEVEWTDAMSRKQVDAVVAWHDAMAAFLRHEDAYRHLVTTSSYMAAPALWRTMDYFQPHAYVSDPVTALAGTTARGRGRPLFLGEFGPGEGLERDDGRFLHPALWAGLTAEASGAAQYWAWDTVERRNLYGHFRAAAGFAKASGLADRRGLARAAVTVETGAEAPRGPLSFGPGGGWAEATQTEFEVGPSGDVPGIGAMPAYLHGNFHRALFPAAVFKVTYPADGTFAVSLRQVARAGARLVISVDGAAAASRDFPAGPGDAATSETLEAKVPAGPHTIKVENTGADWAVIRRFTLAPYVSALAAQGRASADFAILWIYNRAASDGRSAPGVKGTVTVPGLAPGRYSAAWWDTEKGEVLSREPATVAADRVLRLKTPAVARDVAVYVSVDQGRP